MGATEVITCFVLMAVLYFLFLFCEYSLLSFPCVCVCVFAATILDLLHSGDDVRAGREVQVEPISLDQGEERCV